MKRNTRWMSMALSLALLFTMTACDQKESPAETKKTDATAETTVETTTEATTAATEETELEETESEETETTEDEEVVDITETTEGASRAEKTNEWFTLLRAKAEELHGNNDSMFFGYVNVYTVDETFVLITYSEADGYKYYDVKDGEVEEIEYSFHDFDIENAKAEDFLMPYEQFMDFPGFINFTNINFKTPDALDMSIYEKTLKDGLYAGDLYGFSKDCSYAYLNIGRMPDVNLSAEECLNLNVGDTVKLDDVSFEVTDVVKDLEYPGQTRITLGDSDNGGKFIAIDTYDDGTVARFTVLNMWGYPDSENVHLVKVPVAENAIIEFGDALYASFDLQAGLSENAATDDSYNEYTDGGFAFYVGLNVGLGYNQVSVVNGEIAFISLDN